MYEGNKKILSCIQEIIFADYTIYIDSDTFKYCKNLRKIRLPRNLKYLSVHAFDGCHKIIEIDWQDIDSFFAFDEKSIGKPTPILTKDEYIETYLNTID